MVQEKIASQGSPPQALLGPLSLLLSSPHPNLTNLAVEFFQDVKFVLKVVFQLFDQGMHGFLVAIKV